MSHLDDLFAFLSIPSVSALPEHAKDVEHCADFLVAKLSSLGFDARRELTDIHPIVIAHSPKIEGKPTVLIYGHYDVIAHRPAGALAERLPSPPRFATAASTPAAPPTTRVKSWP